MWATPKAREEVCSIVLRIKKVFVSTNATFLKNTYMTDFKPRSKTVLEELQSDEIRPSPSTTGERQRQKTVGHGALKASNVLVFRK